MGSTFSKVDGQPDYTVELQFSSSIPIQSVVAAAEAAGQSILQIYKSEASKWEVQLKSDSSPLTRADFAANQIICDELTRLTPHIPIVSEENTVKPYDVRQNYQYHWLVDPLDGTKEFLKRNGEFTVNIALVTNGVPVLGVVHVPCQAKTYWAVKGKGAWLQTSQTQTQFQAAEFG
ncbi:hypothetical protein DUNSADRAFT_7592 [Dunaliella salina]|uniref:3'(2'),5'-bisphosphate nucleotidase CysQ n=1 Tax=Dunaliella salina TaxID=3046 RepID=A0ABQ7GL30_DUNSA|nr:hypothetical protein DUNSADRAFT_7592 [Dunaliella salina]|eukprot:KAF5835312.1 hypothetical protein DUNSADRAFT_7592 [Dunaliella salina]